MSVHYNTKIAKNSELSQMQQARAERERRERYENYCTEAAETIANCKRTGKLMSRAPTDEKQRRIWVDKTRILLRAAGKRFMSNPDWESRGFLILQHQPNIRD